MERAAVGLLEEQARGRSLVERGQWTPYLRIVEEFVSKHSLIVEPPLDADMVGSYTISLFSQSAYATARSLADTIQSSGLPRSDYTVMISKIPHHRFHVSVDGRDLATVTSLPSYHGIRVRDAITPILRPARFAKNIEIQTIGYDLQLLAIYAVLTDIASASQWPTYLEREREMRANFIQSMSRYTGGGLHDSGLDSVEMTVQGLVQGYSEKSTGLASSSSDGGATFATSEGVSSSEESTEEETSDSASSDSPAEAAEDVAAYVCKCGFATFAAEPHLSQEDEDVVVGGGKTQYGILIDSLFKSYLREVTHVLVGRAAIASIANRPFDQNRRVQIISTEPLESEGRELAEIAARAGIKTKWVINDPKIPGDIRTRRLTLYLAEAGERQAVLDVYNTASFSLTPYEVRRVNNAPLRVAGMFVIMRTLLIDLWVAGILGRIAKKHVDPIIRDLIGQYTECGSFVDRGLGRDVGEVFPTRVIGSVEDLGVYLQRATADGPRFPPYVPAAYKKTTKAPAATRITRTSEVGDRA